MLIDTNQIVQKTDLRLKLSQVFARITSGETLFITERGQIKAKIQPIRNKMIDRKKVLREIIGLRKQIDREFRKSGKRVWNSVEIIRKMRNERARRLWNQS